jgi:hypothetical protein
MDRQTTEERAMTNARRVTLVAIAALGVALSAPAQTASQKCAGAVEKAYPEEVTVWVVAAHSATDHTELEWRSASGRLGVCRLEPDGRISEVKATGFAQPATAAIEPAAPVAEAFEPYQLGCESVHGGRQQCAIKPLASVVMVEQLGDVDCVENLSWGQVGDAIWVDGGCRAVFEVRPRPPRVDAGALSASGGEVAKPAEGMAHPRFLETRAQDQCRRAAVAGGMRVQRMLGTRIDGAAVVVLMEVESWSRSLEATCRWDSATDQAVIAR